MADESGRRRRVAVLTAVATAAVVATAAGAAAWLRDDPGAGSAAAAASAPASVRTVAVKRTDLSNAQTLPGTLGYGKPQALKGVGKGIVTWLPDTGDTVTRGEQLYRADDRPVPLFYGTTPLFRPLDKPGLVGRDVKAVAENLRELGYAIGTQPRPGTRTESGKGKVRKGDGTLTPALIDAIKRWQADAGIPATGVLAPGDVVVRPGAVRVGAVTAQRGAPVATELMTLTSTTKRITVSFEAATLGSTEKGDKVTVTLPDGSDVPGAVESVGAVVQQAGSAVGGGGKPKLTVTVTLDEPDAVDHLDSAPVQVAFTSETREDVLAVPVKALLALREGGYAVQRPDGRLIAVETGMFAKGLVEISGKGVREGLKVVTAS